MTMTPPPTMMTPPPAPGPNKAIAAGLAGAIVTIISYLITLFAHQQLPVEVVAALQTIIVTALVYFVPHGGA